MLQVMQIMAMKLLIFPPISISYIEYDTLSYVI